MKEVSQIDIENLQIIRDGVTTPFNFRIHNPLPDCWRISEHGLRQLLKKFTSVTIEENGTERFLFPVQYKTIAVK